MADDPGSQKNAAAEAIRKEWIAKSVIPLLKGCQILNGFSTKLGLQDCGPTAEDLVFLESVISDSRRISSGKFPGAALQKQSKTNLTHSNMFIIFHAEAQEVKVFEFSSTASGKRGLGWDTLVLYFRY